jgi:hypothetical protein
MHHLGAALFLWSAARAWVHAVLDWLRQFSDVEFILLVVLCPLFIGSILWIAWVAWSYARGAYDDGDED